MSNRTDKPLQDIKAYKIDSTAPSSGTSFRNKIYFEFEIPVNHVYMSCESYSIIEMTIYKDIGKVPASLDEDGLCNDVASALFMEQGMELNGHEVDRIYHPVETNIAYILTKKGHEEIYRNYSGSPISIVQDGLTITYNNDDYTDIDYETGRNLHELNHKNSTKVALMIKNQLYKEGANLWGNNKVRIWFRVHPDWHERIYIGANIPKKNNDTIVNGEINFTVSSFAFYASQYQAIDEPVSKTFETDFTRLFTEQRTIPIGSNNIEFDQPIEPETIRAIAFFFTPENATSLTLSPSDLRRGQVIKRISVNYKNIQYPNNEYEFGNITSSSEEDVIMAYNDFLTNTGFTRDITSLSLKEWRTAPIFYFQVFEESDNQALRNSLHFDIDFLTPLSGNILLTIVCFTRYKMVQEYNQYAIPSKFVELENVSHVKGKTAPQLEQEDDIREENEEMDT
jgi:hypothetical protein